MWLQCRLEVHREILGFDTGHLSFVMSCSFTVQVLAQLDLLRNLVEDQCLQERFPALDKRDRRESVEDYTVQHPVRTIGARGLLPESTPALEPSMANNCSPSRAPAGVVPHSRSSMVNSSSPSRAPPTEKLVVEVGTPSCTRVSSKFRRVRLRQQRHRS